METIENEVIYEDLGRTKLLHFVDICFLFTAKFRMAAILELRRELKKGEIIMLRADAKKETGMFSKLFNSKSGPKVALTAADKELLYASLSLDSSQEAVPESHAPGTKFCEF